MTNTTQLPSSDLHSNLPGVYNAGEKVRELLREWGVSHLPPAAPTKVVQGLDYGFDQDAFACAVSFNRVAGREVNQDIFSVVPFDSNGLGSWAASESLARFGDGSDGTRRGEGTLFVLNSAPGRNVPGGTQNNVREGFFGAKLKNGAIVVGTISDQLPEYLTDQVETMVELPLWDSKSQARGVDVFQTIGYAFYQEASQPGWNGGRHQRTSFPSRPLDPSPTPLEMALTGVQHRDGVPRYVFTSDSTTRSPLAFQRVPVPGSDLRAAAYSAFRLANGSQCRRTIDDPNNVPALLVIGDGFDFSSDEPTEIWAQVQNDGSLVVGPPVAKAWEFSPSDSPVIAVDHRYSAAQLFSVAEQLFVRRHALEQMGPQVDPFRIALQKGPVPGRKDRFGNWDIHNADPRLGQAISIAARSGETVWPVRRHMFDAATAHTGEEANDQATHGFSQQASGGGWRVRVIGPRGEVLTRHLQTSQAYVRTDTPDIPSAAYLTGAERCELDGIRGPFEVPQGVAISVGQLTTAREFAGARL